MYLHLGQNCMVSEDSIIGIFDLDNSSWSHITRKFLSEADKSGNVISVSEEIPKSFILCSDNNYKERYTIYLSQLSSQTLLKRSETTQFLTQLRKESL